MTTTAGFLRDKGARLCAAVAFAGLAALVWAQPARAEFQIGFYGGWSESANSDVDVVQPNGTDLTLHDVEWDGYPLSFDGGPPFYGIRGTYWRDANPNWGFMLDYNHVKVKPDLFQTVNTTGTRDGVAVAGQQPLNQTVSLLEFTDGLNMLTFNVLYRKPHERWTPYAGLGLGIAFPHVEFSRNNATVRTFEYQLTGLAAQALVGLEYNLSRRLALFGEYKISYAQVADADLDGGGTLDTDVWTNHFLFGVSYRFGRPAREPYKAAAVYK